MEKITAYKIAVIESEVGWGSKIDDWMVCLTTVDALQFKKEFNSVNTDAVTPKWYMYADGEPETVELNNTQLER